MPLYIDEARATTDEILSAIEDRISSIYSTAEKALEERSKKFWKRFEQAEKNFSKAVEAGTMSEAEFRKWRIAELTTGQHWNNLRDQCAAEVLSAHEKTIAFVNGKLPEIYSLNYNHIGSSLYEGLAGYSFSLVDPATVQHLALTNSRLLPYRVVDGKKVLSWSGRAIRSEVTQGIIQGESIPHLAKRLRKVAGMDENTSIRTARTMVTSAENKGRMDALKKAEEDGIQLVKKWIATNDNRTREAHEELDGVEIPMDEPFVNSIGEIMFPGDPDADPENVYNCRCALASRMVGFRKRSG